jgi:hypothetical protein
MKHIVNTIIAIIVCAIVNGIYTFYTASTVFMSQAASGEKDMGRLELFIQASEITDNFWPHIIKGWSYGFSLSLASCLFLLLLLQIKTHNK